MNRTPIASTDLRKFLETLRAESDRGCAVLASAFLEASREDFFCAKLVTDAPDTLFDANGPLGTFAARVELAFALGWISQSERADLHIVRCIRDAFAQDGDYSLTFGTPSIAEGCFAMQHSREFFGGAEGDSDAKFPWLDESRADPRLRFEITVSFIRQAIVYRSSKSTRASGSTHAR